MLVVGVGFSMLMWFITENHSAAQEATVVKDTLGSLLHLYSKVQLFFWGFVFRYRDNYLSHRFSVEQFGVLSIPTLSHFLFCVKSSWQRVTKSGLFPAP